MTRRARRPAVWGILNLTPDSFSDGGRFASDAEAIGAGVCLRLEGADVLDLGGESTRPQAEPVDPAAELERVLPVLQGLRRGGDRGWISVDTRHAAVAARVLAEGADLINDVSAGADEEMLEVVARARAGLVLMHMQGDPQTMQVDPHYARVDREVFDFLAGRIQAARRAGVDRLWADPGLGFGKTVEHNVTLMRSLEAFRSLGVPILLGASRKSFLGTLSGESSPAGRLAPSLACVVRAREAGVDAVRVHDVRETCQLLDVLAVIERAAGSNADACPSGSGG